MGTVTRSGIMYLLIWFFLNVGLSLLNKIIFVHTNFKFPVFLSTIHLLICAGLSNSVYYSKTEVISDDDKKVKPETVTAIKKFVILFCFNIAFGNISIRIVNLAFCQLLRSTIPVFMLIMSVIILKTKVRYYTVLSLIPVIVGVGMVVKGEIHFSLFSLIIILIGILLCATKTVVTNLTLKQYRTHPLVLLSYLTPWGSVVMFVIGLVFGEGFRFLEFLKRVYFCQDFVPVGTVVGEGASNVVMYFPPSVLRDFGIPILSGVIAFFLNFFNFLANKNTSPLTMSVSGNIKQVLVVLISIFVFNTIVMPIGYVGMCVAFAGMFAYSAAKYYQKKEIQAQGNPDKDVVGEVTEQTLGESKV